MPENLLTIIPRGKDNGAWSTTIEAGSSVTIPEGYHNGKGTVTANKGTIHINQLKTYPTDNGSNPLWTFFHYSGPNDNGCLNVESRDVFYMDARGGISIYNMITFEHDNPYFILTAKKELMGYEVSTPNNIHHYNPGDQIAYVEDTTLNEYVLWEPSE